jgi:uncharacterized protein (TIGR03067 family)
MRSLLFAVLLVAAAPADDAAKKDLDRMQGDWAAESYVADGMALPDDDAQALFRTVKGDEYSVARYTKTIGKGRFTLDASKKPCCIDALSAAAPKGSKPILGIYELNGDTFRMCFAAPGKDRPTAFESKPGSGWTLVVWKREKK